MPTWLSVAEKPSVAKEMASVLSEGRCKTIQSLSRFNPVFEFTFEGNTMLVTSVAGHLMEDEFPPTTKSWTNYPFKGLFSAKITKSVKAELEPVQRNVQNLAKRAHSLLLWLDCDREGENICFEVIQVARGANPRLDVKRAHFSALTPRDLLRAVRNLKVPDKRLSDAVEARQEMDLRIGAVFTRFQTIKFRDAFSGVPRVLSFGPCQFPTLGFVVRRYWEQKGFVPENFFTLKMTHGDSKFSSSRGAMYDQIGATMVFCDMMESAEAAHGAATVTHVTQKANHRRPPVPLATVVLQKLASTHLRISSERCMALAESLYQEGFISYPRTETDSFSFQDSELLDLVRTQASTSEVAAFATAIVTEPQTNFRRPLRGGHDDKAHPPIHPTKAWSTVPTDEKGQLYLLVVRHFLACLSPDAVAATTSVAANFGDEAFTTSGTTVLEKGWLDVFPYESWHNSCIPNYKTGETFTPTDVRLDKGRSAPPPSLTESNLIALMDSNGIGTDATIAQHIKTILDREYVKREGQTFVPTRLGIALASAYEVLGLASLLQPQLRAQMELAMADIASGQATKEEVVSAAVRLYTEIFDRLSSNVSAFQTELAKHLAAASSVTRSATNTTVVQPRLMACGAEEGACTGAMDLVECKEEERDRSTWYLRCAVCALELRVPNGRMNSIEATRPPQKCALCSFTALHITNREKRTAYYVCPHCFTNPPRATEDIESIGEFRCFQCIADCPLATGRENVPVARCVSCQENDLRLRTTPSGAFLSCKGYPTCAMTVSLPKAASITPCVGRQCPNCSSVLLTFDFRGMQSVPGLEPVETICVSCDPRVKDYISVKGYCPQPGGITPASASSGSGGVSGGGGSGSATPYALPSVAASTRAQRQQKPQDTNVGGNGAVCGCGVPAKQLVSRKETSRGKRFLTCARRQCNFFQWLD